MMPRTKKYIFVGVIMLILIGVAVGYVLWKKERGIPEEVEIRQQELCNAVATDEPIESDEAAPPPASPPSENQPAESGQAAVEYSIHRNITATVFWVGEKASGENKFISNSPSAWDEKWKNHYGGTDSATKRNGYLPSKFCPKENPFYTALPYNDFGENGKHKEEIFSIVPWVTSRNIPDNYSVLKNRWVKIIHNGKEVYAQWEDVGPFEEDDSDYVFGNATPKSKENKNAGIDVSPAVRDYLGLSDIDTVDWQFIEQKDVPDGAWKKIITTSQVFWK